MNLGPKLIAKPALRQTLTPGLVQMVNILAMNKLELQEAITQEVLENPLLDEAQDEAPPSLEELQRLEEGLQRENAASHMDAAELAPAPAEAAADGEALEIAVSDDASATADSFEEIDYGDFFKDYLDSGYHRPEREETERPSFDNFLSAPTTLSDHLRWQLSVEPVEADLRAAAEAVIGNLDEDGYLTAEDDRGRRPLRVEEIAESENMPEDLVREALSLVQRFDPPGVAARDLRECLLIQLFQRPTVQILAITLVSEHLSALQNPRRPELARSLNVSLEEIEHALIEIRQLDPYPGRRYNPANTRLIEPDVAFVKG
ncbi:MAG: RNA polymerase factor sigma-54, partial [Terriglobales bacterium]